MLLALDIKNFALIEKLYLEFSNGLNIITGETGAGKSIVVDSINFVTGARFGKDIIKKGTDKAEVQAMFELSSAQTDAIAGMGFECEQGTVSLYRGMSADSKTVCRFNGRVVTLSNLKQISSVIMEVHGQHENQLLFDSANHIGFLDGFAFKDDDSVKEDFNAKFKAFKDFRSKILDEKMDAKTIKRRLDEIDEELKEFEALRWKAGEEEKLKTQTEALENAEAIINAVGGSYALLYGETGCAYEQLKGAVDLLFGISEISEEYGEIYKKISSVYYELEDAVSKLREKKDEVSIDPQELENMQRRLFEFAAFKKKYGGSEENVLKHFADLKAEKDELSYKLSHATELREELKGLYKTALESADVLSKTRREKAVCLEKEVVAHLSDLGMQNARFKVDFGRIDLTSNGIDKIEFFFCANKGQDLKPLTKVASGGEISRLMLALKNVDLNSSINDAMVFDEIDTGISGKMAHAVAEKLKNISNTNQVICVTHLPQVAAMGDYNVVVRKSETNGGTKIDASVLTADEKVKEVARLISGSGITESGLEHARQLILESLGK